MTWRDPAPLSRSERSSSPSKGAAMRRASTSFLTRTISCSLYSISSVIFFMMFLNYNADDWILRPIGSTTCSPPELPSGLCDKDAL